MRLEEAVKRGIVDPAAKYQTASLNVATCDDNFLAGVDAEKI